MTAFGDTVRDVVSGFEGTVIARAEYAYSVPQVLVAAATGNGAADARWIEEDRVEPADGRAPGFSS